MYAEVSFGWRPKFTAALCAMMDAVALSPIAWKKIEKKEDDDPAEDLFEMPSYKVVLPIDFAEMMATMLKLNDFSVSRLWPKGAEGFLAEAKMLREKLRWNDKARSPVVDSPLLSVAEVLLLEDCCTDELSAKLASGWSILAVCPQPSRRPDYILGRGRGGEPLPVVQPKTDAIPEIDAISM